MSVRQGFTGGGAGRYLRAFAVVVVLAVGTVCASAAPAMANGTEETMLLDDAALIYSSPAQVEKNMIQLKRLGVDQVKISVVWALVAPDPNSTTEPSFKATDPNAYPSGGWNRYDWLAELGQRLGMSIYFQLTAPAPLWAVTPGPDGYGTHPWSRLPDGKLFGEFAQAVGKRYSGSFVPPGGASLPAITSSLKGIDTATQDPGTAPTVPGALPGVRWWSIWNEPNEQGWLSPQYHSVDHHNTPWAPQQYRGLLDGGYAGLANSGHANDHILIGDTSSGGAIHPVPFLRDLYCVDVHMHQLTGTAASRYGCPTSGSPSSFVSAHPGLFDVAGYSDHPYSFYKAPNVKNAPGSVTLYNLGLLETTLGQVRHAYGQGGSLPIWVSEWGYKTNPPNPFVHTTLTQQATYLNEGEYMSWRMPFVHGWAQFELRDDKPRTQYRRGSAKYWATFQTGLEYLNGKQKPSYAAFRIPIWVPSARAGRRVTIWGQLRPGSHASTQRATLQFRPAHSSKWKALHTLSTHNSEGFLLSRVSIPGAGSVRLAYQDPAGGTDYSRTVSISR